LKDASLAGRWNGIGRNDFNGYFLNRLRNIHEGFGAKVAGKAHGYCAIAAQGKRV
jgi:hypothetical protein